MVVLWYGDEDGSNAPQIVDLEISINQCPCPFVLRPGLVTRWSGLHRYKS
ncbi:hypothetical protein VDBG_01779 [Verticillium alfalfae VaMs.102]|uniref:Uncharacterized protein n=1 Tax=Verticillium alfalfae (strain VaMs.102 / ATCC MYA-4576 / FGSC 10136) TaxID=526221 RepID=C9SBD6_VERA1|nr:hypothetical protein VDBG_01779 [Verticillium alfalfae VaMs.102]EEY15670.1 hypothetical protein VDBG_01779 [Verticillium alfalfae VaMs.102]